MSLADEVNRSLFQLRQEAYTLKQWIAEENEDPQGPISQKKKVDEMNVPELEKECEFLRSSLQQIYTHKLQVNSKWEKGMESLSLHDLRGKASGLVGAKFTIGAGNASEEVLRNRQTR